MSRSRIESRRPQCPECLQYMPAPDKPRDFWLCAWGHRREDGQPCPGFRKAPTIAPPPPMSQRAPPRPPMAHAGDTITVEAWRAIFDAMRVEPAKRPRMKRERVPAPVSTVVQLQLFTSLDALWCDAAPANRQTRYEIAKWEPVQSRKRAG